MRLFLSVSAQALAGPVETVANSWTYAGVGLNGAETETVAGPTTFNGMSVTAENVVDVVNGTTTSTGQNYYALLPSGYFSYGFTSTSAKSGTMQTTTYSPNEPMLPPSLSANVPVTSPTFTETDTVTTPGGSPEASTTSISDTFTLVSETPSVSVMVPGNNYLCYQVNVTDVQTPQGSSPTTDMSQYYFNPSVGLVQIVDMTTGSTVQLTNFTGTSTHLAIIQGPSNTLAGDVINPPVQIALEDTTGTIDTNPSDAVTITASIAAGSTGTGTLTGATPVTTVGGVASFSGLTIDKPGRYSLNFADTAGRSVGSASFQISAGKLVFKERPTDGTVGTALKPAVEVKLEDSHGKIITDAPSAVTLNISGANSSNPITGNTAQLVDGIAVFNDLKLTMPDNYVLNASDDQGDVNVLSKQFEIKGTHLAFIREVGNRIALNAPLRYAVALEDSKDKIVSSDSTDGVRFSLTTIEGGTNAMLSSVSDIFVRGVAINDTAPLISINSPGIYTLTATEAMGGGGIIDTTTPATSKQFEIVPDHLRFIKEPGLALVKVPLEYKVALEDFRGHTVTTSMDQLKFTLITIPSGGTGTLASGVDTLLAGIADNSGGNPLSIDTPGEYALSVVDVPANPSDPSAMMVLSRDFKVVASKT